MDVHETKPRRFPFDPRPRLRGGRSRHPPSEHRSVDRGEPESDRGRIPRSSRLAQRGRGSSAPPRRGWPPRDKLCHAAADAPDFVRRRRRRIFRGDRGDDLPHGPLAVDQPRGFRPESSRSRSTPPAATGRSSGRGRRSRPGRSATRSARPLAGAGHRRRRSWAGPGRSGSSCAPRRMSWSI